MKTSQSNEVLNVETSPFAAEDYVQMACQLRRSAEMRIRYSNGGTGGIIVQDGELWHAWDTLGAGPEAFLRMVGNAHVTRIARIVPNDVTARSITTSCQKLLLEAVINQDARANDLAKATAHEPVAPTPDSELTRPNWPMPYSGASTPSDLEPLTARSFAKAPAAIRFAIETRTIMDFLRRPVTIQRAAAALFGMVLLLSVAKILAPAGDGRARSSQGESQLVSEAAVTPERVHMAAAPVGESSPLPDKVSTVNSLPAAE
jgi:hypothetical protein